MRLLMLVMVGLMGCTPMGGGGGMTPDVGPEPCDVPVIGEPCPVPADDFDEVRAFLLAHDYCMGERSLYEDSDTRLLVGCEVNGFDYDVMHATVGTDFIAYSLRDSTQVLCEGGQVTDIQLLVQDADGNVDQDYRLRGGFSFVSPEPCHAPDVDFRTQ